MLRFETPPSYAFNAATAQLEGLRRFSASTEAQLDLLAGEVLTQRFGQVVEGTCEQPDHQYRAEGSARGYLRPEAMYNSAYYKPSANLLREKFLSDIAHDMRLPHTTYALAAINPERPRLPNAAISLIAIPDIQTIDDVFVKGQMRPAPHATETKRHDVFFAQQPHLAPAFAALSVFDIWVRNFDRHESNVIISAPDKTGYHHALYGIDLDKPDFYIEAPGHIESPLDQRVSLFGLPAKLITPAVNATLQAIENYPASRMKQLADRLQPYNSGWNMVSELYKLQKRQPALRHALPRYFSNQVIIQPA